LDAKGIHHGYIGLLLMLTGFILTVFTKVPLWICIGIAVIGFTILADDFRQHAIQRSRPEYRSPLNRWYGRTLYRIKLVRVVNEWVDKLLGRKPIDLPRN